MSLRDRVAKRIKAKRAPKRIRRIAGIDIAVTPEGGRVHICACLLSFPKLEIIEEAIATDELDEPLLRTVGNVFFVPLVQSVLKMLKRKADVVMIREPSFKESIPLASYVGVISGRPSFGVSERCSVPVNLVKWDGIKRGGMVKIRGHKTPIAVVAGHLMTFVDATRITKACCKGSRIPEPIRSAGMRVRAWERQWRRVNIEGR